MTYVSGDNASDDANTIAKCMPSPHTTISPLDLFKEILRSPESSTESDNIDIENETSCFCGTILQIQRLFSI